jgi:predicted metal-dependent peptidase
MKVEIKAGLLTTAFVLFVIVAGSMFYFLPEVAATIVLVGVVGVMIYHLYHSILDDLRRVEKDKLVDPKRDRM